MKYFFFEGKVEGEAIGEARGEARGIAIGEAKGIAIGKIEEKKQVAKNLLKQGVGIKVIIAATGLPEADIQALKEKELVF